MIAAVREGKLISMEGDYDHIVNSGSLCVKGISMFATHASLNRLTTPRYRPPGSDHWEEISWDDAIARVAQKIRKTRDATWIATEKVDDKEVPVRREHSRQRRCGQLSIGDYTSTWSVITTPLAAGGWGPSQVAPLALLREIAGRP